MTNQPALLRLRNLTKHFPISRGLILKRQTGAVQAVDDVTFDIHQGETLGLVGESGSGKTTLGRTLLQLIRPTDGEVFLRDTELTQLDIASLQPLRQHLQIIFQDPYSFLNPRWKIGDIVREPLVVHNIGAPEDRSDRVSHLLELVGLDPDFAGRYPHEFSGGQRQRVAIARAIASEPEFVVCDEPISALDVSIQSHIVNLLKELQEEFNLTYLFIAHDLSMVRHISDRVAVMYLGQIVELAPRDELFANPRHPYTEALLSAVPIPNPAQERKRKRIILVGDVPNPADPPTGCRFHTRCPYSDNDHCVREVPQQRMIAAGHHAACHYADELDLRGVQAAVRTTAE